MRSRVRAMGSWCVAAALVAAASGLVSCRAERNTIADAFARNRMRSFAASVEAVRSAYASASSEIVEGCGEVVTQFSRADDRDGAFVTARRTVVRCRGRIGQVESRIRNVESNALDLFEEWSKETREYTDDSLRERSRADLADLKARWEPLHDALRQCMEPFGPILTLMDDDTLALKHRRGSLAPELPERSMSRYSEHVVEMKRWNDVIDRACTEFKSMLPLGEPAR
jgi:Protein of unknown function (DUF2959)